MTRSTAADRLSFQLSPVGTLSPSTWQEIVDLCSLAYEEDFRLAFQNVPNTTHIIPRFDGQMVSHACWITRWLQPAGHRPLRTAFVEAVATAPGQQRLGFASAVMARVAEAIKYFDLGGLSTGRPKFYKRLGWEEWRGPLRIRTQSGLLSTPTDQAMVLRLPLTPQLDLDASMSAEWRPGELW